MFVYRPHVHGLEVVTTPDLILDVPLSSAVWSRPRAAAIGAAWVVVAASYGPLLTIGLIDGGKPWIIARSAWRLADLDPGLRGLALVCSAPGAQSTQNLAGATVPVPHAGEALFVPATFGAAPSQTWCEVSLVDAAHGRTLSHRMHFTPEKSA